MIAEFNLEQQIAIALLRHAGHPNPEAVVDQERMLATALCSPLIDPLTQVAEAAARLAELAPRIAELLVEDAPPT